MPLQTLRPGTPRVRPALTRERDLIDPELRQTIRDLCEAKARWPLMLTGPAGTGKTRAVLCLVDAVRESQYFVMADLCRELIRLDREEVYFPGARGGRKYPEHVWEEIERAKLIVLDEIGSRQQVSDFHYETLKRVIDAREDRPFVAISNLSLGELAKVYDDRIASRLAAGTLFVLDGEDRRISNAGDEEVCG
ncbi:MAG: hypothetical protein AMXMBFR13_26570 [Phycisphaerae bacterium]